MGRRTVVTDGNTEIGRDDHHVSLAELKVGDTAKVEGTAMANGIVLAREIKVGGHGGHGGGDGDDNDDDDHDGDGDGDGGNSGSGGSDDHDE